MHVLTAHDLLSFLSFCSFLLEYNESETLVSRLTYVSQRRGQSLRFQRNDLMSNSKNGLVSIGAYNKKTRRRSTQIMLTVLVLSTPWSLEQEHRLSYLRTQQSKTSWINAATSTWTVQTCIWAGYHKRRTSSLPWYVFHSLGMANEGAIRSSHKVLSYLPFLLLTISRSFECLMWYRNMALFGVQCTG